MKKLKWCSTCEEEVNSLEIANFHQGHNIQIHPNDEYDPRPACECGWDGKVDWKAKGQKCPDCGVELT